MTLRDDMRNRWRFGIAISLALAVFFTLALATDMLHKNLFFKYTSIQDSIETCIGFQDTNCDTEDGVRAYNTRLIAIIGNTTSLAFLAIRALIAFFIYGFIILPPSVSRYLLVSAFIFFVCIFFPSILSGLSISKVLIVFFKIAFSIGALISLYLIGSYLKEKDDWRKIIGGLAHITLFIIGAYMLFNFL